MGEFYKPGMGVANPASENCIALGGKLETVDSPTGQYGMCTLPDGTVCEEWALYRKECGSSATTPNTPPTTPPTGTDEAEGRLARYLISIGVGAGVGLVVGLLASNKTGVRAALAGAGAAGGAIARVLMEQAAKGKA